MFGSKRRQIEDLKQLLRVQDGKLADAKDDLRAVRHAARAEQWEAVGEAQAVHARLERALRVCARYRAQAAIDRACFNELAARYWQALGYGPDTLARLDPSYAKEDPE